MPIFTAIAAGIAAVAGAVGFSAAVATTLGAVGAFAARTLLTIGISKLLSNRAGDQAAGTFDNGSRIPLAPSSSNSLSPVYGSAYISHTVVDAKISTDQKTMWYVCAMAEVTDTTAGSGYTYGDIYYGNRKVTFDGTDPAKVVSLTVNTGGSTQVDTKIDGKLYMYLFRNGSDASSGVNAGGLSAIQIMSDLSIPADLRWDSALYTSDGQSAAMTNTAFIIVKVIYDTNAGTNGPIQEVKAQLTNSLYQPGSVIKDYLLNTRYGCAVPLASIDTASLIDLNTYSAQQIEYSNNGTPAYQDRYRIDGPVNTGTNCLTNLQQLVDSCDSWLQYSELTGQWKVVVNKAYDQAPNAQALDDLFLIDSSILIGGIDVNPIDLNSTYNQLEVQHPAASALDQTSYPIINLVDYQPSIMSYNEPVNKLVCQFPQVNNHVQAVYLGIRRMLQSREDLVITCQLDYSGIQIEAGDVVRVTLEEYGWAEKLFRVSQVQEAKLENATLGARITAFEYNESVYGDDPIDNFVLEPNTGLGQTSVLGTPAAPLAILNTANTINQMHIEATVPTYSVAYPGQVLYMDFNYGNTSNSAQHVYYTTVNSSNGQPLTNGANVSINVTDIATGNVYWSATARNDLVGVRGPSTSNAIAWVGPTVSNVTLYNPCNASSSGNLITTDAIGGPFYVINTNFAIVLGAQISVEVTSGTGVLPANTFITSVISNTQFTVNNVPSTPLSGACVKISSGGVAGDNIKANTVTSNNMTKTGVVAGSYTNTDLTVDSAGRITSASNGGGGGTYNIQAGTSPFIIIGPSSGGESSVVNYLHNTTYPLYDISIGLGSGVGRGYLDGTTVSSNYFLPFASGTSDTGNLFIAGSTAGYGSPSGGAIAGATPPLAAIQGPLYANYSGSPPNLGGWALLKEVQVNSNYTPGSDDYVRCECTVQLWADANTNVIYGGSYALSRGGFNNHYITQDKVGSIQLLQYLPHQLTFTFTYRGGYPSANPVLSMALWMKNVVSGTRVHFLQTSMILSTPYIYGDYTQGFPFDPYA